MSIKIKYRWIALAVVVLIAIVAVVKIIASRAKPAPATDKTTLAVVLATPGSETWPQRIVANGVLAPWQEVVIGSELSGLKIEQLLVDVGSRVKKGQTLVVLSQASTQADLHKQEALLAQAKASLVDAKATADRSRSLKSSGALSDQQVLQAEIAEETAKANVASAQAQLDSQKIKLEQTRIVAVDDGVISSRSASLGNIVNAGGELLRLVRQGRIEWRAELTADQAAQVQPGRKAVLRLSDGSKVGGSVRVVSPTLESSTRNVLVYVDLPTQSAAKAGMYLGGEIALGSTPALTLPQSAIVMRDGHNYVFELQADNLVKRREVSILRRQDNRVDVSGISAQAKVVASGGAFLSEGDAVRVTTSAASQATAVAK